MNDDDAFQFHLGPRRPGVPLLVFAFLPAGSFLMLSESDLRLFADDGVVDRTLKKPSRRPCVEVVRVFWIFLHPPRMRSSLN